MRRCRLPALVASLTLALTGAVDSAAEVQEVEGTVSIRGEVRVAEPVRIEGRLDASRLVAFEDVLVPPLPTSSGPEDVSRLVFLGMVDASGFRTAMASIVGWFPAQRPQSGTLGLLLVPDVAFVSTAHERDGVLLLDERVIVTLATGGERWFSGAAPRFDLRFPRYRAFLYNSSTQAVRVSAFVHLQD